MGEGFFSRGFSGRRRQSDDSRLPPGQYREDGFPVLSAGPTPRTPLERWDFSVLGEVDEPKRWTWEEFRQLPSEQITKDIHCVTKWSKFDTRWEGVSVDTLLEGGETSAEYVTAFCDGGYTTNLPLEDVTGGKAWVAFAYDGEPLEPEHGRGGRAPPRHAPHQEPLPGGAGLGRAQGGPARGRPAHRPRRLPGAAQLLHRVGARGGAGGARCRASRRRRGLPVPDRRAASRRQTRVARSYRGLVYVGGEGRRAPVPRRRGLGHRAAHSHDPAPRRRRQRRSLPPPLLLPLARGDHLRRRARSARRLGRLAGDLPHPDPH